MAKLRLSEIIINRLKVQYDRSLFCKYVLYGINAYICYTKRVL